MVAGHCATGYQPGMPAGIRCLIVDDNANFLEAATSLLQREGVTVVGVASPIANALQQTREAATYHLSQARQMTYTAARPARREAIRAEPNPR